jgi:hypothetical protein
MVSDLFECRSLGKATLKGEQNEVAVFEVLGPIAAPESERASSTAPGA